MPAEKQNETVLNAASRKEIDRWLEKYPPDQRRSAIPAALRIGQQQNDGWLCDSLLKDVAAYLEVPPIWVYEAANFYGLFHLHPVGRHVISICDNISCMLCGADALIAHVKRRLGVELGETTRDGRITLVKEEECLAGCVGAPMMVVDGHYHEHLTIEDVDRILDSLE